MPKRFLALDAFRGFAIAGMILVNTPGSWAYVYRPLMHADWHGSTLADLVFPFFLFATGAAMSFSFAKYEQTSTGLLRLTIVRRVAILFVLGLFLNWFGFWSDFAGLRILGVLQRIAFAYGLAAFLILGSNFSQRMVTCALLLLGYWWLLVLFGGADPYALEDNIVRKIDIAVLGAEHLWQGKGLAFDPEGLLSTLPAVVNVVIGYEAANLLRESTRSSAIKKIVVGGVSMLVIALLWSTLVPINKSLWTPSYVLYSSGMSLLLIVGLTWIASRPEFMWLLRPAQIFGFNPIVIYALSWLMVRSTAVLITFPDATGARISAYEWFFTKLHGPLSGANASLLFALIHVLLFWVVAWYLYRRGIVVRI